MSDDRRSAVQSRSSPSSSGQGADGGGRLPSRAVVLQLSLWLVAGAALVGAGTLGVQALRRVPPDPAAVSGTEASAAPPQAEVVAFPGAEGYGASAKGGRGGKVYVVSNLNDAGPGSLRACVEAAGPRTCVFRVAGTIVLGSWLDVEHPYLTIAGQTAPGGGITLRAADPSSKAHLRVRTHDVIVRYLRSRPGTRMENGRALTVANDRSGPDAVHDVIVDHVSLSWSADEIFLTWYETRDVTVQWSILAESLPETGGTVGLKGPNIGSDGGGRVSLHHNLIAHHVQRYPKMNPSAGPVDLVNNAMYNMGSWGHAIVQGGARVNFVNNYVKPGPNTTIETFVLESDVAGGGYYRSGNVIETGRITRFAPDDARSSTRYPAPPVTTTPARQAFGDVLAGAGAIHGLDCDGTWFSRPDPVDARIVRSVREGTRGHAVPAQRTFMERGYITSPSDVGGWPELDAGRPCADGDEDGMPDVWERAHGLDPELDDSAGDADGDGYTNLEEYLNGSPG